MPGKRQQIKRRRRLAIVEASAGVFSAVGFGPASISRIAEAMGMNKSAVGYHHFTTKREIAEAVVALQQRRWRGLVRDVELSRAAALTRLFTLLYSAALDVRESPVAAGAVRLLAEEDTYGLTFTDPESVSWYALAEGLLEEARATDEVAFVVSSADLVRIIFSSSYGLLLTEKSGSVADDTGARLLQIWSVVLTGAGVADVPGVLSGVLRVPLPTVSAIEADDGF